MGGIEGRVGAGFKFGFLAGRPFAPLSALFTPNVPRYKLTIAYDGTDFCGWQKQEPTAEHSEKTKSGKYIDEGLQASEPGRVALRTVQGVVERAIREVVREPIVLLGASRTDSGVHARGQIGAFTTTDDPQMIEKGSGWPIERGTDALVRAVNGRLPDDVLVTSIEPAVVGFDPIGDCTSKGYSYTIHASRTRPLWDRRYVHQVWEPIDVSMMRQAASVLVGEHDFAAFAAAGHGRLTTVRTVHSCDVLDVGSDRIRIEISGSGFLWNMVRIVAGTLADVGRGRLGVEDVQEALRTGDRRKAGPTFPACGLCLEWVKYGEKDKPLHP